MTRTDRWLFAIYVSSFFAVLGGFVAFLLWDRSTKHETKTPAQYPIFAKQGKENITVAVLVSAAPSLTMNPDFAGIDRELAYFLDHRLVKETEDEDHPVLVIEQSKLEKIRQANAAKWDLADRCELAKQLGADYLIEVHITGFTLHNRETGPEFFHGRANMNVSVYEADGTGAAKHEYPHLTDPELRANEFTVSQYRTYLLKQAVKELARNHVPHTPERDVPSAIR